MFINNYTIYILYIRLYGTHVYRSHLTWVSEASPFLVFNVAILSVCMYVYSFDTVPHTELLQKLKHIGISGSLLKWFRTYTYLIASN